VTWGAHAKFWGDGLCGSGGDTHTHPHILSSLCIRSSLPLLNSTNSPNSPKFAKFTKICQIHQNLPNSPKFAKFTKICQIHQNLPNSQNTFQTQVAWVTASKINKLFGKCEYLWESEKSGVCLHLLNLCVSCNYLVLWIIYKCFSYFTTKQNKIKFIVCNLFFLFPFW
jgi:hypothetical protein